MVEEVVEFELELGLHPFGDVKPLENRSIRVKELRTSELIYPRISEGIESGGLAPRSSCGAKRPQRNAIGCLEPIVGVCGIARPCTVLDTTDLISDTGPLIN